MTGIKSDAPDPAQMQAAQAAQAAQIQMAQAQAAQARGMDPNVRLAKNAASKHDVDPQAYYANQDNRY